MLRPMGVAGGSATLAGDSVMLGNEREASQCLEAPYRFTGLCIYSRIRHCHLGRFDSKDGSPN